MADMAKERGLRGVVGTFAVVEKAAVAIELWTPEGAGVKCGQAYASSLYDAEPAQRKRHEEAGVVTTGVLVAALKSHRAEFVAAATEADVPGLAAGFSAAAVPVLHKNVVACVALFLYAAGTMPSKEKLEKLRGDLTVAVAEVMDTDERGDVRAMFKSQAEKVAQLLKEEKFYLDWVIDEEVAAYYSLGISQRYFAQESPEQVARHLSALIGAKRSAKAEVESQNAVPEMSKSFDACNMVDGSHHGYRQMSFQCNGPREAAFFCLDIEEEREDLLRKANEYVDSLPSNVVGCIRLFRSESAVMDGLSLLVAVVVPSQFCNSSPPEGTTNVWELATASFLRTKGTAARQSYEEVLKKAGAALYPTSDMFKTARGHKVRMVFPQGAPEGGLAAMYEITDLLGFKVTEFFGEAFSNGSFMYSVEVVSLTAQEKLLRSPRAMAEDSVMPSDDEQKNLTSFVRRMVTLAVLPRAARANTCEKFGPRAKLYLACAGIFTYHFMPHSLEDFHALRTYLTGQAATVELDRLDRMGKAMNKNAVNMERFNRTMRTYPDLAWKIYDDFIALRRPGTPAGQPCVNEALKKQIRNDVVDPLDQEIFQTCLLFNAAVLKTNFFSREKAATSFRLDPKVFINAPAEFPEVPHGIFLVVGPSFEGFHVRFRDIARGGIRMIRSPNNAYFKNQQSLFEENYNLAYTQQLKNKDIPEGGSKGTILLNPDARAQSRPDDAFKMYIDSLLDVILENDQVVNLLGDREILFFGPDEGTAGSVVVWAAEHAAKRGYPFWKAITTGKPATMGGIPHDKYGMTTRSVHQQVLGILRKVGVKEEDCTKFQTGGPDGDLGSNEIKISKDRTIGIVDGAGVVFDPIGLDRAEITRLATNRQMVSHFDTSKLSREGYRVLIEEKNVTLPSGEVVESGLHFRNEYHLNADMHGTLFVPCGGRPNAVNINNVHRMFKRDGTPRFKYVCEGANLFFTRDARKVMEDAGVILMKDATCNKGGVTSSSLEVLAALAMTPEQHNELMCVRADGTVPDFYEKYVVQVQAKIEENARLEFEACWREREAGEVKYMAEITDLLSKKINQFNDMMQSSATLRDNQRLQDLILSKALPPLLIETLTLRTVVERVPSNYLLAICGAYFASQYVYTYGLKGSEVQVLDFIQNFVKFAEN
eukprot:TRINITY_DN34_c0_g1_i3.p2 TRINITY_DN34_c0_g1~~TRINITY_DN34_c0_g1_i3.p2  ORF type:complete len:1159 (+),score=712.78 TRINITY_DN34_c0_g1_i3:56-3532(+)